MPVFVFSSTLEKMYPDLSKEFKEKIFNSTINVNIELHQGKNSFIKLVFPDASSAKKFSTFITKKFKDIKPSIDNNNLKLDKTVWDRMNTYLTHDVFDAPDLSYDALLVTAQSSQQPLRSSYQATSPYSSSVVFSSVTRRDSISSFNSASSPQTLPTASTSQKNFCLQRCALL